ncbi:MAG: hypothetical protein QOF80_1119 [Verrucomicrobiota bacterium]
MKRLLLAVAMLALVFPALRQAEARTDISIDFFYDNIGDDGNWIEAGEYGYCWQPNVAVSNTSWRPYSDGYWAYTDVGWTWVSYEDFGWATYHYGRWARLKGHGWVWAPGREWGPAWVSWRTGGDYVGWAPLPPRRGGDIYVDFSPITAQVDVDFDIGPAYYNFIDVRYIGEPVLRERIFAADQNVTYVSKTVNVTNITYNNSQVYNYGPDYNTLSRYSARPIQKLTIQRETNGDPLAAARSKSLMKVQGDKLMVAAPQQFQKPPKPISPKVVKEKLAQAPVEHGWEPVNDPKAQAELREKMKKEDPKSVPPPTVQVSEKTETNPAATAAPGTTTTTPTVSANASPSAAPSKDKNKRENVSPAPGASASVNPAMTPGKNKNRQNEKVSPLTTPSASVPAVTSPAPTRDKGKNKQRDNVAPSASVPPATGATETTAPTVAPKPPRQKPEKSKNESAVPPPLDAVAPKSAPRIAPPPTPETKRNQPGPDVTRPEAAVEKPKQPPSDIPKPKKEQALPTERMLPPSSSANAPGNPQPPRDEGKKKDRNVPATSPTP